MKFLKRILEDFALHFQLITQIVIVAKQIQH